MRLQIVNGIYTDNTGDFRSAYPINMRPIPKAQGLSSGYLRYAEGAVKQNEGAGISRGGIEWRGACYRVLGTSLVRVNQDGSQVFIGSIPGTDLVTMTYSFDRLAIAANKQLYYYDGTTLTQVADPDIGDVNYVVWIDGYFVTTDGEFIVVTELTNPEEVDPLKYGSSESDPDPVLAVMRVRNELYAVNRYSIEAFQNVGGSNFPFQVIRGAQVERGAIGAHMCTKFQEAICFVGSGRNESLSVWLGGGGNARKIGTQEIDTILESYTTKQLEASFMEVKTGRNHNVLYIHLPDKTLCYDASASEAIGAPAWYQLNGGVAHDQAYPISHIVRCYDKWLVASRQNSNVGYLDDKIASLWGDETGWQFSTPIIYNETNSAVIHSLELVANTGAAAVGDSPRIYAQYSLDGITWSQRRFISAGTIGDRLKRLRWLRNGKFDKTRIQRFGGTSKSPLSISICEANIEALAW